MTLRDLLDSHDDAAPTTGVVVLDGAVSTELEAHGVPTDNNLWGALAVRDAPEAIGTVHADYLRAGSRVITTNTYQATVPGFLAEGFTEAQAKDLITRSGVLALDQVRAWQQQHPGQIAVAAGSIGPYGAFLADGSEYTGAYHLTDRQFQDFHRPRLEALREAGITVFAVETQPRLDEVQTILGLLAREFPDAECWVSFQLRDPRTLADGTPLADAARWVDQWAVDHPGVVGVGFNCVSPQTVTPGLQELTGHTSLPLVCYPNSGDTYDPATKTWQQAVSTERFTAHLDEWLNLGVRLIGGCCRTTPSDITVIAEAVDTGPPSSIPG